MLKIDEHFLFKHDLFNLIIRNYLNPFKITLDPLKWSILRFHATIARWSATFSKYHIFLQLWAGDRKENLKHCFKSSVIWGQTSWEFNANGKCLKLACMTIRGLDNEYNFDKIWHKEFYVNWSNKSEFGIEFQFSWYPDCMYDES